MADTPFVTLARAIVGKQLSVPAAEALWDRFTQACGKRPTPASIDKAGLQDMTKALIDLGLDITVTELDVKESESAAPTAARDQKVADETRRYLDVMLAFPEVRGVVTWGLTDKFSWLSEQTPHGVNRGLPYDDAYSPKPMYWALADTLLAKA